MELFFEVRDAEEGGFFARALGHAIFTDADTWDELRTNILEAVGNPQLKSAYNLFLADIEPAKKNAAGRNLICSVFGADSITEDLVL